MTTPLQNIIVMLYKGVVETSLKSMWHSHDFKWRSETNQDVTSHNVTSSCYLAGYLYLHPLFPETNLDFVILIQNAYQPWWSFSLDSSDVGVTVPCCFFIIE